MKKMRIRIKELSCNELLNNKVCVAGWIKKVRKLGNLCFLTLWDETGSIQIVDQAESATFNALQGLGRESIIQVEGILQKRSNPNKQIVLGDLEIKLENFTLISKSKTTPLIIENETDALEEVRLKYRYLDLRRPIMHENLKLRFQFLQAVRNFLASEEFIEIETPNFTKPTPEGARDYVVPTRLGVNRFYALPQSPQIYKQLLMISGFERYFQIARCFRDEDGRKDRQPEHTQIDIEMSFVNVDMIQATIEKMFAYAFEKVLNLKIKTPFLKMKYADAISLYGTDKPDMRYEVLLEDVTNQFKNASFQIFNKIANNGGSINLIHLPEITTDAKVVKTLENVAKDNRANGLAWITYENNEITGGSIAKALDWQLITTLTKLAKKGTLFFVGHEQEKVVKKALGAVRVQLNEVYQLADNKKYAFLWITDWPLYEWNDLTNTYESAHNLFTAPDVNDIDELLSSDSAKATALASSYDLVLNGFELGSGALRIHNPQTQRKIMQSLNLSDKEIEEKFGFLLEAYEYGAPYHGGMGLGLDRIMMIIANTPSIRDVIAFPKNAQGIDLMMDAPAPVNDTQFLDDIFIDIKKK